MEKPALYKLLLTIGVVRMQWKRRKWLGRAAGLGVGFTLVLVLLGGLTTQARGDAPNGGAEHVPAGRGMGQAGGGWAAMNRPTNDTQEHAMKELLCPCGTCTRLSILDCDCATAAQLRAKVQALLAGVDLSDDDARTRAYESVLHAFTAEYGENVIATPKSNTSWLFPLLAVLGGLGLLVAAGRRWLARGRKHSAEPIAMTAGPSPVDEEYADRLDDELAETD